MNTQLGKSSRHVIDLLFTLALFCVFAVASLLVVYIGAEGYKSTIDEMEVSFSVNTPITYVSTKIRQHDQAGSVRMAQVEGQNVLILEQDVGGATFQTWIYYHNGALREMFINAESAAHLNLDAGQELLRVHQLTIDMPTDRLVSITAQSESGVRASTLVGIRSS